MRKLALASLNRLFSFLAFFAAIQIHAAPHEAVGAEFQTPDQGAGRRAELPADHQQQQPQFPTERTWPTKKAVYEQRQTRKATSDDIPPAFFARVGTEPLSERMGKDGGPPDTMEFYIKIERETPRLTGMGGDPLAERAARASTKGRIKARPKAQTKEPPKGKTPPKAQAKSKRALVPRTNFDTPSALIKRFELIRISDPKEVDELYKLAQANPAVFQQVVFALKDKYIKFIYNLHDDDDDPDALPAVALHRQAGEDQMFLSVRFADFPQQYAGSIAMRLDTGKVKPPAPNAGGDEGEFKLTDRKWIVARPDLQIR